MWFRYAHLISSVLLVIDHNGYFCLGAGSKLQARIVLVQEDPNIEFGGKLDLGLSSPSSSTYSSSSSLPRKSERLQQQGSKPPYSLSDLISQTNSPNRQKFLTEKVMPDQPNSDVILSQSVLRNTVDVRLECSSSSFPVKWEYTGHGHPPDDVTVETKRTFSNFYDPATYQYFATMHLPPSSLSEKNTGNYTCKSLTTPSEAVYYYIYVPGIMFFVAESGQTVVMKADEKTFIVPCSTSAPNVSTTLFKTESMGHPELVLNPYFDPKTGFILSYKDPYSIELASTDSESPFGEYICTGGNDSMTTSIIVNVQTPRELVVRPVVKGRYVFKDENIKQRFICEGKKNLTFTFSHPPNAPVEIVYRFVPSSEFPFVSTFIADPRQFPNHSLIHCTVQSKQSMNNNDNSDKSEGDLHMNSSEEAEGEILHNWEYSNLGNDKTLKFLYNETLKGFLCCTENSGVAPQMIPYHPCSSPIECELRNYRHPGIRTKAQEKYAKTYTSREGKGRQDKKLGLDVDLTLDEELETGNIFTDTLNLASLVIPTKSRSLEPKLSLSYRNVYSDPSLQIPSEALPMGCRGFRKSPINSNHEGYFRCSVRDDHKGPEVNANDYFFAVIDGKPILAIDDLTPREDEKLVRIYHPNNDEHDVKRGQEVEMYCEPNTFFFSKGHVLAFERSNGSLEIVPERLVRDQNVIISSKSGGMETFFPKRIRTLVFPDLDIVRLHCFAPMFSSSEWHSSSIPIKVRD